MFHRVIQNNNAATVFIEELCNLFLQVI